MEVCSKTIIVGNKEFVGREKVVAEEDLGEILTVNNFLECLVSRI